jgi:hypothetical protein
MPPRIAEHTRFVRDWADGHLSWGALFLIHIQISPRPVAAVTGANFPISLIDMFRDQRYPACMFGSTRRVHPQHRDQYVRRMTTSVILHCAGAIILLGLLFVLLSK